MAQKKKSGKAVRSAKKGASWQGRREEGKNRLLALIAIIGVIAIVAAYFLDSSALLAVKTDERVSSSTVRLNELMTDNISAMVTESGDVPDWIEITNTGNEDVNIGKYSLLLGSLINRMFSFPEYTLAPGECLLVYAEGMDVPASARSEWSAPFKLSPSGGETLVLMNAQGKAVDTVEIPELGPDVAYRRDRDGSWSAGNATPGADNSSAGGAGVYRESGVHLVDGALEVTEVMSYNTLYFADENGEHHDYVEVHNKSNKDVNLQGWYLSDSSDKLKRWSFPAVILPPDAYIAVHCSGYNRRTDAYHLHTDFRIGTDGENIYLSQPDGRTVSMAEVPAMVADQAYSLTEGGWNTEIAPTPGQANTQSSAAQIHSDLFGDRSGDVYISEVMASATDELVYDWLEIYNGSSQAVNLSDYGLSDSPDKPRKWQFPQGTTIQPGQYMGVYLSGTETSQINGLMNADFALEAAGGYTVTLASPDGDVLDAMYLPKQYTGISYGRMMGENGTFYFEAGSPGSVNGGSHYRSRADMPQASVKGGLFKSGDSFTVELDAPEGSRIYYTLDSTDPTEKSTLYMGPIQVSKTTILRSKVYRDGYMPSLTDTQSYLYDVSNGSNIYVASVVSDPSNLYGSEGIISNYMALWEKEGHFELFTAEGERVLGQGCGLSLHGQDSRKLDVKTFNVIARSTYGKNRFEYPIFDDRDYTSYHSFLMRPSGEDYQYSFMRDTVLSSLMDDTSVMHQKYEPVIVYMNGEYYTLCYLRERINKYSVCQFEGWEGMEKDIDLVRGNVTALVGSNDHFEALLQWIKKNDTTTPEAYEYLDSQIDIQNYIEYMALQIFVGNTDTLNVRRYRNAKADGKWRWILFDLDWSFFNDTDSIRRWLTPGGTGPGNNTDNTLFIGCMKNPTFREQFLTYFGERMATTFSSENVISRFENHYRSIEAVIPQYEAKWGISLDDGISRVVRYAKTRPGKLLNEYFPDVFNMSAADKQKYFGDALDAIQKYANKKEGK